VIDALRGGLVVSVQAPEGSPLREPDVMAAIARAAEQGGAAGIRANGADDIAAIRSVTGLPLIGLNKRAVAGSPVYITPAPEDVRLVADAGADIVAVDATERERPVPLAELIAAAGTMPVVADVDTLAAGVAAHAAGAAVGRDHAGGLHGRPVDRRARRPARARAGARGRLPGDRRGALRVAGRGARRVRRRRSRGRRRDGDHETPSS